MGRRKRNIQAEQEGCYWVVTFNTDFSSILFARMQFESLI